MCKFLSEINKGFIYLSIYLTDDTTTNRAEPGSDVRTSVSWSPATCLLIAGGALDPLTSARINLDKFSGYYCRGSEAASLLLLSFSQWGG